MHIFPEFKKVFTDPFGHICIKQILTDSAKSLYGLKYPNEFFIFFPNYIFKNLTVTSPI
jgi:hypothetical protein